MAPPSQYDDFNSYHKFCTARLHRLYKGLRMNHGRSKFIKRCVGPDCWRLTHESVLFV